MSARKYVRVEKVRNGYVIQTGGTGSPQPMKQWVAESLDDVMRLLATLLEDEKEKAS